MVSYVVYNRPNCKECAGFTLRKNSVHLVCGENGVTYLNKCFARCNRVDVRFYGRCPINYCARKFQPVCTASGNSYLNPCEARYAGEVIVSKGRCGRTVHTNLFKRSMPKFRLVKPAYGYRWP